MEEICSRLDIIIKGVKANMKLCNTLVEYISNNSLATDRKIENLGIKIEELKKEIQKNDKLRAENYHAYTDQELSQLKKSLSWNELNRKTKIPLSTLQYRVRRYMKNTEKKEN